MADQWYIARDKKRDGPYSLDQMKRLAASGTLLPIDMVWQEGMSQWVPASQVEAIFPPTGITPAPPPLPGPVAAEAVSASGNGPSTSSRGGLLGYKQEVWDEVWERCRQYRTLLVCLGSASLVILVAGILLIVSLRSDDGGGKALLGLMCPGCVLMPLAIGVWIVSEPIRKQVEARKAAAAKEAEKVLQQEFQEATKRREESRKRAKEREEAARWEKLHGRWEPIDGQGAALQFTEDGALIRQDGLIAKYRIQPGDLIELYADDSPTTIQFKVMSLSEHELALTADGQGKHYIRGRTYTEEVHRQEWEAYKKTLKGIGTTAAKVAGGAALAVGGLAFLGLAAAAGGFAAGGGAGSRGSGDAGDTGYKKQQHECSTCHGKGWFNIGGRSGEERCPTCGGHGVVWY